VLTAGFNLSSVIGQPTAVKAVANAIRLNRSGLGNSNRPIASFLLVGPSGTGKTLLAKTVAQCMFNSADAMIRIDASEFSEKHTVSRLVGSTAGYIGYEGESCCRWGEDREIFVY
jgi:ATP-dependent Clp protease ATP-binding subunit ClpA